MHPRRVARGGQAPPLDGRQMPAYAIHLADAGAAGEQRTIHGLLQIEVQSLQRQWQQGGAAAGEQAQHEIVRAERCHEIEHALRRVHPGGIRYRMRRLDDFYAFARYGISIARDHQA